MAGQGVRARDNQKKRTRADLLRAAQQLVARREVPTVTAVADAAGISRATAYRYFSTTEQIIREAALDAIADEASVAAMQTEAPAAERLDLLIRLVVEMVAVNEELFRAFLAGELAGSAREQRSGRRLRWLEDVLQPDILSLPSSDRSRLLHALALLIGIEPWVVLHDVCGLPTKEAEAVLCWAGQALLRAAVDTNTSGGR